MDIHMRKMESLRRQTENAAVARSTSASPPSRASTPQPSSAIQSEKTINDITTVSDVKKIKKVVYKEELQEVANTIIDIKNKLNDVSIQTAESNSTLSKQIENIKNDLASQSGQSKLEKISHKLDDFISKYNANEVKHSNDLIDIENTLHNLDQRLKSIEEMH